MGGRHPGSQRRGTWALPRSQEGDQQVAGVGGTSQAAAPQRTRPGALEGRARRGLRPPGAHTKAAGGGARHSQGKRAPSMPAAPQPEAGEVHEADLRAGVRARGRVARSPGRRLGPRCSLERAAAEPRSRVLLLLGAAPLRHRLRPGARGGRSFGRPPRPARWGGAWHAHLAPARAATCGRAPAPPARRDLAAIGAPRS